MQSQEVAILHNINKKIVLLNGIPILLYPIFIVLPNTIFEEFYISTIGLVIVLGLMLVLPFFLVILNYFQLRKSIVSFVVFYFFIVLILALTLIVMETVGWLLTGKCILNTDDLSVGITLLVVKYELFVSTIGWIIACIIKWIRG